MRMPTLLSEGSQHYNQMRRIHPRDSISQLGYYLGDSSSGQSANSLPRLPSAGGQPEERRKANRHTASSSDGYSTSALSLSLSQARKRTPDRQPALQADFRSGGSRSSWTFSDLIRRKTKNGPHQPAGESASGGTSAASGAFSQNTQAELTFHEYFDNKQVHLSDANGLLAGRQPRMPPYVAKSPHGRPPTSFLGSAKASLGTGIRRQLDKHQAQQPSRQLRLKRRNHSRRMVGTAGGEPMGDPYALSELFSQSEIPGFREIFASDSYLRKFCWIVAFLFMTVLSLNDITELVTEYYEYPITVDVRMRDSSRLQFPAVTVCNLNVVRFSALCSSSASSPYGVNSQMPPDLRDKLCGIQVERNNASDLDLGDINHFGMSTSSAEALAAATPPAPVSSRAPGESLAQLVRQGGLGRRTRRSIQLGGTATGRPFASAGARPAGRAPVAAAAMQPIHERHQSAGQFNKQGQTGRLGSNQHPNGQQQQPQAPRSSPAPWLASSTPLVPATTFVPLAMPEDFELTERQERELQANLTNWLAVMHNRDPRMIESLGHQFDDMILRCTMKSINCTHARSFERTFSPTEGNCFTYRSKVQRRSRTHSAATYEEANLAGTNHGLELVLNLEKGEYISGSSQVGALVMIHHPSELGYAASEATFVAPEFTTYIGLKMVNITRLPAPYPEYCVDSWPAEFADALTRNSTYSQQACLKICLQKTIQLHCHCQSATLPTVELDASAAATTGPPQVSTAPFTPPGTGAPTATASSALAPNESQTREPISAQRQAANQAGAPIQAQGGGEHGRQNIIICDTRKQIFRQCVREVTFRAADRVHNCDCPPKCQVIRYDKTISMAKWPTREDKVTFDRGKMDVNFQNLAKVIVYFQTMTCDEILQQPVFNAAKLFSALGGIMGMYVGFSFLSVFEIFEVMSRKMWHLSMSKLMRSTGRLGGAQLP